MAAFAHKNRIFWLALLASLPLLACGDKDEDKPKPPESAEQLYNEARDKFDKHEYKDSVKAFEEIERQHPSSEWAIRGQIMSAYASYEAEDYNTAVATLQRFVKLYPSDESTPYAYYMIALCNYEQINDVGRDQKITEDSMQALREVIRRFPDSEYARDARIKLDLTTDHMAGKEMEIGRYYERHEDYIAAINRFRSVVENYQTTTHVPEALHRLVECYLKLGVTEEAQRYAAVLGHNFPDSSWYRDSYKLMMANPYVPKPPEIPAPAATPIAAPVQPAPQMSPATLAQPVFNANPASAIPTAPPSVTATPAPVAPDANATQPAPQTSPATPPADANSPLPWQGAPAPAPLQVVPAQTEDKPWWDHLIP